MKKLNVPLGTGGSEMPMPVSPGMSHPTVYLRLPEGALELPDSGKIVFAFRVSRETEDKREGQCCYDLDLTRVLGVEADASEEDKEEMEVEDAGSALDRKFKQ